mgnify:CR=1 FL=1
MQQQHGGSVSLTPRPIGSGQSHPVAGAQRHRDAATAVLLHRQRRR